MLDQLTLEPATALNIQSLVNRLVLHPHLRIIGEVLTQQTRDLLGTLIEV